MAPPKPVMQNVGLTLMLGMGQALGAGIEGAQSSGNTIHQHYYNTPEIV